MKTPQSFNRRTLGLWPRRLLSPSASAAALALGILSASTASAEVIAGWDTYSDTGAVDPVVAPILATGVTASFVTTTEGTAWDPNDERGASIDGTWGTNVGPPAASTIVTVDGENLTLPNGTTGGTIAITITNGSGADIDLDSFHFDAYAFRPNAARAYELSVLPGGAISEGIIFTSEAPLRDNSTDAITQVSGTHGNDKHDQIDHELTVLEDSTLEDGGSVEFLLSFFSGTGSGGGHHLFVDNLAVTSSGANANKLAFTVVPPTNTAGTDFSVTVEAQDSSGTPLVGGVTQNTEILLGATSFGDPGTGILSGNTATILAGTNFVVLPSLQYTVAEVINLNASQVSGDLLSASAESASISVNAGPPSVLTVESSADGLGNLIGNTSFRITDPLGILDVFAISRDSVGNFIANETTAMLTLENITGDMLADDLVDNMDGSATFTAEVLGTANIRATVSGSGYADVDSGLITVEEPQFRWTLMGGQNVSWGTAANWLDGVLPWAVEDPPVDDDNTIDLFLRDEYSTTRDTFLGANRTVRSLNFLQFINLGGVGQTGYGIRYTRNPISAAVSLTFDTDSTEDPAEINVAAGTVESMNLGNVNTGLNLDDYGDTILADPLLITHLGTGTLIFSRPIAETGGSMGVTLDASSTGTVVYQGANSYTGVTTVNGGILRLNGNSIADTATLVIDGGVVDVTADEYVVGLTLGEVAQPNGEYGSTESGVENPDDTNFTGVGRIIVGPPPAVDEIVITDISFTGEEEVTITFTSPGNVDVYGSTEDDGFVWSLYDGNMPSGTWVDEFASAEKAFYILVTADDPAPPDSP